MFIIFSIAAIWCCYKLVILNFVDDRQYLLTMIEHNAHAIAIADAHETYHPSRNAELTKLIKTIRHTQEEEIEHMYQLLAKVN